MARCKFKCISKNQTESGFEVTMEPVTHGSAENEKYFKWTPYGKLNFGTLNAEAAERLIPGKEYYLDITPTE